MEAPDRLPYIVIPVTIRQSKDLCQRFNLNGEQVPVLALLDTGASGSCLSTGLARRLGLRSVEKCYVSGVGGIHPSYVYMTDIILPNQVTIANIRSTEFIDNGQFDVIIGMDIITLGDLAITNHGGRTCVSFRIPPGEAHTDYTKSDT
jgi:hypothetical protein